MDVLKWMWGYVKDRKLSLTVSLFLSLIFIASAFVIPVVIGYIVDDVIYGGHTEKLMFYSFLLIAGVLAKEAALYTRHYLVENVSQSAIKSIRNTLYARLQSLDCAYYNHTRKGDIMSRLTMDAEAIRVVLALTLPGIVDQAFFIIIGFGVMSSASLALTLMLFATAPFILIFAYFLKQKVKKPFADMRESSADLNTVVSENISGSRVVKAYAKEEYEKEKFEKRNDQYKKAYMSYIYTWVKFGPALTFFVHLTNLIFIVAGGVLVMKEIITVGEFTIFNGSLWCVTSPMASVANFISQFQRFNASAAKIRQLENEQPKVKDGFADIAPSERRGKIQFKNVTFAYDNDRVLKNINFTANAGDTIAIVGPTGSGKTTMIDLIERFYDPTYGTVYIDDVNIKTLHFDTLRKCASSAMQDVFLFSDTVRNNIAYGSPDATDEEIREVAKAADALNFIEKLPDGFNTLIGERGVGLSGGQRQRISLARALLKKSPILILDDTTSALDMETEYAIQENLKKTKQTKVIIAHRISSVKNADLILVLNHGNLVEWGTHDDLIAQNGYYKGVFDHQFGDFNNAPNYHISHPTISQSAEKGGAR